MGIFKTKKQKALEAIDKKINSTNKKVDDLAEKIDKILEENKCKLSCEQSSEVKKAS